MQNGANRRGLRLTLRILTTIALLALLGCGAGTPVTTGPPQQESKRPQTLAELRAAGRKKLAERRLAARPTRAELQARRQAFARVISPEARLAFERAGLPTMRPVANPAGKDTSTALPISFEAFKQYTGPGDFGYFANSPDVTFRDFSDPMPGVNMNPAGASFPGSFSYVIYRVDDVTQLPTAVTLWLNGPFPPVLECGLAVYNWAYGSGGRWEPLFYGDASSGAVTANLDTVPGASWTNGSNNMAFAMFALNPHVVDVAGIEIAEQPSNFPPDAYLEASPSSGPAPLATTLDASLSQDWDGTIVNYSFDPGDGTGFVDNGTVATFDHTYINPGPFTAVVQVTDDGGLTSEWQTTVIVSPASYDEVEDNDDAANAQILPTLPFVNFSGGCGIGGNNDGLDNDDYFQFQTDPVAGDKISVRTMYADDGGNTILETALEDAFGNWLTINSDPLNPMNYEFQGWETGPFRLHVSAFTGASDYYLSIDDDFIIPVSYDEWEDNDDVVMANELYLEWNGSMPTWVGSLGSGVDYPGNDGDTEDWSYFGMFNPVPEDAVIQLDLTYDTVNSTAMSITLYDANANELAFQGTGTGHETVSRTVQAGDAQPFYVKLRCGGGWGDYNLEGSVEVANPGFAEDEHNDNMNQANDLGPLPLPGPSDGNIGFGGNYDSDPEDYYTFQASAGLIQLVVTPDDPGAFMSAYMFDGQQNQLGAADVDPVTGAVTLDALVFASTPTPLYLVVQNWSAENDYVIDNGPGATYSEVEDNDTDAEANPLPFGFFGFFSGSLGDGGSNYDGDMRDELTFSSQSSFSPYFDIYIEKNPTLAFLVQIRDAEGDILGNSFNDGSGHIYVTTSDPIDAGDLAPYYLVLECPPLPGNFTDYWVSGEGGP